MDVVQLHLSVLTIKLVGYSLCVFFAARALNRLSNLNIDIGGKLVRIEAYLFLAPFLILLVSPIFDVLYEVYGIHSFQHVSMVIEGIAGLFLAFAFLRLYTAFERG